MVRIGDRPILWHIMNTYASFGHREFLIALGYKGEQIKEYFLNYRSLNGNFSIDLKKGQIKEHSTSAVDWKVSLIDTGLDTMTGGRIQKMREFIGDELFFLTYGDGLADVDIHQLLEFHKSHGKIATVTTVRPVVRFGELTLNGNSVAKFEEKPQLKRGWINGGFFVFDARIFELIEGPQTMLEREPMDALVSAGELMAFRHEGFWQCMDTKRDHELLQSIWESNSVPWEKRTAGLN
jgi:glucose-1-phosphate cytidylyltransferase